MATMSEAAIVYRQTPLAGQLTLIFDVQLHKKYGLLKPEIANLEVNRSSSVKLKDLLRHLDAQLEIIDDDPKQLLLKGLCLQPNRKMSRHLQDQSPPGTRRSSGKPRWGLFGVVPLVCDQILSNILVGYPEATLRILVNQHVPQIQLHTASCMPRFFKHELKYLDVMSFLPTKNLKSKHILNLCRDIFEGGIKVKPELRRGVWLHLVGVFPPHLSSRQERERYMEKLRMAYDHLKGKLVGESSHLPERQQLADAVHRDAIRTDPNNPFFANCHPAEASYISQHYHHREDDDNNIQKLINIIIVYTLEHDNISYTQGMTDMLSPILYTMRNEADAYICFSAMVERIKDHFGHWCTGTLQKLERLRHLCEVLDPKLYQCLTSGNEEDPFVLFFGMVLIECRREFSFEDSFHLLETVWAGATCMKNSLSSSSTLTNAQWAFYMTNQSPEVLQQVFEESGVPYSAEPLPYNMSGSYSAGPHQYSRNSSLLSQSPVRRQEEVVEPNAIPEQASSSSSSLPEATPSETSDSSAGSRKAAAHCGDYPGDDPSDDPGEREAPKQSCLRLRSQSDSMLKSHSSQNDLTPIVSPRLKMSLSPHFHTPKHGADGIYAHKLGNCSFSHSESELYDSFSNGKIVVHPKTGRNLTELSDMSSISSGTVSANGNLISSLKSIESRNGMTRNLTPDYGPGIRSKDISRVNQVSTSSDGGNSMDGHRSPDGGTSYSPILEIGKFEDVTPVVANGTVTAKGSSEDYESGLGENGSPDTVVGEGSSEVVVREGIKSESPLGANIPPRTSANHHVTDHVANQVTDHVANHVMATDHVANHVMATDHVANHVTDHVSNHVTDHVANHVTVNIEVYPNESGDVDLLENCMLLPEVPEVEVVKYRGMITSVGSRSPLLSQPASSARSKPHPQSDGAVSERRRKVSSPRKIHRTNTPTGLQSMPMQYDSSDITSSRTSHRVTPVAFFDTMEKLARSVPAREATFPSRRTPTRGNTRGPHRRGSFEGKKSVAEEEDKEDLHRPRNNSESEITLMLSQIVSTEEGAPRVTSEDSLSIPFSNCYSLFVCLSILVQSREEIMETGSDFYQLSTILNAQASIQDLDKTLQVAQQLYRIYRKYQEMWFGRGGNYDNWLDDAEAQRTHPPVV